MAHRYTAPIPTRPPPPVASGVVGLRVAGINLHPVKSTAIRPVQSAYVGRTGLVGDREWMVVDPVGEMVSAREIPALFRVVADTPVTGGPNGVSLRLSAPELGAVPIEVDPAADNNVEVTIHGRGPYLARAVSNEVDQWLENVLETSGLRLVWCSDPAQRRLKPELAQPDDRAAFQDNSPISIVSTSSVSELNSWIASQNEAVSVQRFRPNIVIDGAEPFAEDSWNRIQLGDAILRVVSPIDRCAMTTINPATLDNGKEPIRTLARHRMWDSKTWFAVHAMIERQGPLKVGDEVIPA